MVIMGISLKPRNALNQKIIEDANIINKELERYNARVLITFLKEELNRDYDEIKALKIEKQKIMLMLSKLKRDIFKDTVVLDIEELNKTF